MSPSSRDTPRPDAVRPAWLGASLLGAALLLTACGKEAAKPKAVSSAPQAQMSVPSADQKQAQRAAAQAAAVALRRGWSEGHQSTVACLHGERAQTDGNELRCEEQTYVERNYPAASSR
jgi:hypothetical protein